jgi:hypothetical protein
MSLYQYFESGLQENPELLTTRQLLIVDYNGLRNYFKDKVNRLSNLIEYEKPI